MATSSESRSGGAAVEQLGINLAEKSQVHGRPGEAALYGFGSRVAAARGCGFHSAFAPPAT